MKNIKECLRCQLELTKHDIDKIQVFREKMIEWKKQRILKRCNYTHHSRYER